MSEPGFAVDLTLRDGYSFDVDFGLEGVSNLVVDEPPPLGAGAGPGPTRLLAAAVANCLGASLVFCLRKARIAVEGLRVRGEGDLVRTETGRLRVRELRVRLQPTVAAADLERIGRCLDVFEDFCIVGQSVQAGIPLRVLVEPAAAGAPAEPAEAGPMPSAPVSPSTAPVQAAEAPARGSASGTKLAERGAVGKRISYGRPTTSGV